jgi:hypothetical protein
MMVRVSAGLRRIVRNAKRMSCGIESMHRPLDGHDIAPSMQYETEKMRLVL